MDYVNEFFKRHTGPVRPNLVTMRGDRLSVQASRVHYCSPRVDNADKYGTVEVFWEKRCPKPLRRFTTDKNDPAGWVPVDAVNAWIRNRGGLAN